MSWPDSVQKAIRSLENVKHDLKSLFTGRDEAVDLLVLAVVCREHLLLIGPPGTAKTGIITRFCDLVQATGFHYLLSRFTEPSELFGPLDLEAFQKGSYHIRTSGMLPEAQVAFLDEVFQGSSPILNSLLTIVNERVFHNGNVRQAVPLASLVGASNILPEDPWLRAFADRFILRLELQPTPDDNLDDLLDLGWELERERIEAVRQDAGRLKAMVNMEELRLLHIQMLQVDLKEVRAQYANLIRDFRRDGVDLSDRRVVRGLKLVAGAALLRGGEKAAPADLWPLQYLWARPEEGEILRGTVRRHLAEAGESVLSTDRPVDDILLDLEAFESQEPALVTEAAWVAHVSQLNTLRKELLSGHRGDTQARARVEEAIRRGIQRLELTHV